MRFIGALLILAISVIAQPVNNTVIDEKSGKPMLVGECDRDAFADSNFAWWFDSEYRNYEPDETIIGELKEIKRDTKIEIYMGSWCGDSRREVPRFYKILDLIDFPVDSVSLYSLDREKSMPGADITDMNIFFVPTFIFYRQGKEIGRIIEIPQETLESDFLTILTE